MFSRKLIHFLRWLISNNLCAEPQFFSKIISTSAKFSVAPPAKEPTPPAKEISETPTFFGHLGAAVVAMVVLCHKVASVSQNGLMLIDTNSK